MQRVTPEIVESRTCVRR